MSENHLTPYQLSKRWSLAPKTLEKWRWRGIGPSYVKVGSRVLYRLSDIVAYEREGQNSPLNQAHLDQSYSRMTVIAAGAVA